MIITETFQRPSWRACRTLQTGFGWKDRLRHTDKKPDLQAMLLLSYPERIQEGELINLKKDFQFFPTPGDLADDMINRIYFSKDDVVLEPSAGSGALLSRLPDYVTAHYEFWLWDGWAFKILMFSHCTIA